MRKTFFCCKLIKDNSEICISFFLVKGRGQSRKKSVIIITLFFVGGWGQRSHFLFVSLNGLIRPEMQRKNFPPGEVGVVNYHNKRGGVKTKSMIIITLFFLL